MGNGGSTIAAGSNFIATGSPFTPVRDMTCEVTTSVQVGASSVMPAGSTSIFFRNARMTTSNVDDGVYGHYLTSTGTTGNQPSITRTSVFAVSAGVPTQFGAYLGNFGNEWVDSSASVHTSYSCS
jgi:hypothetical protein